MCTFYSQHTSQREASESETMVNQATCHLDTLSKSKVNSFYSLYFYSRFFSVIITWYTVVNQSSEFFFCGSMTWCWEKDSLWLWLHVWDQHTPPKHLKWLKHLHNAANVWYILLINMKTKSLLLTSLSDTVSEHVVLTKSHWKPNSKCCSSTTSSFQSEVKQTAFKNKLWHKG